MPPYRWSVHSADPLSLIVLAEGSSSSFRPHAHHSSCSSWDVYSLRLVYQKERRWVKCAPMLPSHSSVCPVPALPYHSEGSLTSIRSSVYGILFGRMDTPSSALPGGNPLVREPSKGTCPSRMGSLGIGSHQYIRLATRAGKDWIYCLPDFRRMGFSRLDHHLLLCSGN